MDNKEILTKLFKKITIRIEGMEIPILNQYTERIEINCHEGCVGDIKHIMRLKKDK